MRLSKRFTGFVGLSLSCVALLISKRFFICCDRDRETWMIFVFLYNFYFFYCLSANRYRITLVVFITVG